MNDDREAFELLDEFVQQWMEQATVPGLAVAITDKQRLLRISTFGQADVATKEPITPETLFEIGSLGKPFTSIALLQLRDEGKLDLHRPVVDYLPWFRVRTEYSPITVHHLMNHTAGIVRGTDLAPHGLYEAWALRDIKASAPPGEYFSYSNVGYKILGFLLETLTGQTYSEALQSRVLDPLGMTKTHPVISFQTRKMAATGYCGFYDDRPEHSSHGIAPAIWAEYGTGDGAPASTAEDMTIYLRMLLNRGIGGAGRLLSTDSFNLMALNGTWTGGDYYGYGLATYAANGHTYIGHGGGNAGFRSAIVVDLEAGLGVVFLLNRMGETDPVVEAAQNVLTMVRGAKLGRVPQALPPVVDETSVPDAADFAGDY